MTQHWDWPSRRAFIRNWVEAWEDGFSAEVVTGRFRQVKTTQTDRFPFGKLPSSGEMTSQLLSPGALPGVMLTAAVLNGRGKPRISVVIGPTFRPDGAELDIAREEPNHFDLWSWFGTGRFELASRPSPITLGARDLADWTYASTLLGDSSRVEESTRGLEDVACGMDLRPLIKQQKVLLQCRAEGDLACYATLQLRRHSSRRAWASAPGFVQQGTAPIPDGFEGTGIDESRLLRGLVLRLQRDRPNEFEPAFLADVIANWELTESLKPELGRMVEDPSIDDYNRFRATRVLFSLVARTAMFTEAVRTVGALKLSPLSRAWLDDLPSDCRE